jgi:hypothetical protein
MIITLFFIKTSFSQTHLVTLLFYQVLPLKLLEVDRNSNPAANFVHTNLFLIDNSVSSAALFD